MSHFTVLVIGENPEKQLLSFKESPRADGSDGFPQNLLKFRDEEDQNLKEFETKKDRHVVSKSLQ